MRPDGLCGSRGSASASVEVGPEASSAVSALAGERAVGLPGLPPPNRLAELRATLGFFGRALTTGRDFELLQAVLAVFLRIHQATLAATPELLPALQALHEAQGSRWGTLREQLHGNLCLLSFLCRTRT